jgi:glycosyltransferase involved in cell wall biosynthesis
MKSILIIIPYNNIYPPMNGGMQRCFNVLYQLTKHFDLTAIIHQDKNKFLKCAMEFPSIASAEIYSTKDYRVKDIFSFLPSKFEKALRYRWYKKQIFGPADENFLLYYSILKHLLKTQKFDAVILENLTTLNAISLIRKYDKEIKIVYDAHNVDTNLAKAALAKNEILPGRLHVINKSEQSLYKIVDAVFACSDEDKETLMKMNMGKLKVETVPNGVNVPGKKYNETVNEEKTQFLIFCGSLWSIPNAEGLHWFCKKIWPPVLNEFPGLKLLVVGIGDLPQKYEEAYNTPSAEFTGAVDDVKPWYNKAAISVVPLITGSGTRLKILEAMGMGVPVISTTIGAEGIEYTDDKEIIIADKENDFANKIIALLKDKNKRERLSIEARNLAVLKYDWDVIGDKMESFLKNELV